IPPFGKLTNVKSAGHAAASCYLYGVMRDWLRFIPFYTLAVCSILPATVAQAQSAGVVRDRETGLPIRSATINIGNLRTTTDAGGRFSLAAFTSFPITISASHIGYEPASITLYAAPDTVLHLSLLPKTIGLKEVRVLG